MNAIANAFKRAKGISEDKIEGSITPMSTGHRKLLAEQVMASTPEKRANDRMIELIQARAEAKRKIHVSNKG